MKYTVFVDDNFHFMDEGERCKLGEFKSAEAAIAAARKIVDEFLKGSYTELGRSEIDGIAVEGVESQDVALVPAFLAGPMGRLSAAEKPDNVTGNPCIT